MGEEIKRKRGRPKKDGSKYERVEIRVSSDMARRLTKLSDIVGMTKTDILCEAFDRYEQLRLLQQPDEYSEYSYDDFGYYEDDFSE